MDEKHVASNHVKSPARVVPEIACDNISEVPQSLATDGQLKYLRRTQED